MRNFGFKHMIIMVFFFILGSMQIEAATQYEAIDLRTFQVKLPVTQSNEKYGYLLLTTGKWIIPPKFDGALNFNSSGRARVSRDRGWIEARYGYIDLQGNVIIKMELRSAHEFSEGVAAVIRDNGSSIGCHEYINPEGKKVIDVGEICNKMGDFEVFGEFHEGLAEVRGMATYGFLDKMGKLVIEPKFSGFGIFSEDVAVVKETPGSDNAKYGVIDKSGSYVIAPQYALLKGFTEGLAAVQIEANGMWGFIDKTGQVVLKPQYSGAGSFHNGLAPVMQKGKWGFIDKTGKMVIHPQFDAVEGFQGGIAKAELNQKYGWISASGNWVVRPMYNSSAVYWPTRKIIYDGYYYDVSGKKLNHYANHMTDAAQYLKDGNYKSAEAAFNAALKINPLDEAASWGLRLAKDSQRVMDDTKK